MHSIKKIFHNFGHASLAISAAAVVASIAADVSTNKADAAAAITISAGNKVFDSLGESVEMRIEVSR